MSDRWHGPRLFSVAALALAASACRAPEPRSADREAVLAVLEEQVRAWNRGDLEGFLEGYLDSPGTTYYSGKDVVRGRDAILERYRKSYRSAGKEMGELRFEDLLVEGLGPEAALVRGRFRLRLKSEERTGLFTLLLRRTGAGFRIVHDHTSG